MRLIKLSDDRIIDLDDVSSARLEIRDSTSEVQEEWLALERLGIDKTIWIKGEDHTKLWNLLCKVALGYMKYIDWDEELAKK